MKPWSVLIQCPFLAPSLNLVHHTEPNSRAPHGTVLGLISIRTELNKALKQTGTIKLLCMFLFNPQDKANPIQLAYQRKPTILIRLWRFSEWQTNVGLNVLQRRAGGLHLTAVGSSLHQPLLFAHYWCMDAAVTRLAKPRHLLPVPDCPLAPLGRGIPASHEDRPCRS